MSDDLEKEFEKAVKKADEEIQQHFDAAVKAIKEAVKISEKYGVPYRFPVSLLNNTYTPKSFDKKWEKLREVDVDDSDKYLDLFDNLEVPFPGYYGWEYSDVC